MKKISSKIETLIIGAGPSGLACAIQCHKNNKPFLLIEQSDRVGGRVGSFEEDGFIFDLGFQVYNTAYQVTNSLLDIDAIGLNNFRPGAMIHDGTSFQIISDPLREFGGMVASHIGKKVNMREVWNEMGYTTGNGRDMTSVMYRMDGPPIHEQTLGSADAMLLRLLDGDEWVGGTKQPYDPRIHFVLIRDAYIDANPDNTKLQAWLNDALKAFDEVYSGDRPGFLDGYKLLKNSIKPWGN